MRPLDQMSLRGVVLQRPRRSKLVLLRRTPFRKFSSFFGNCLPRARFAAVASLLFATTLLAVACLPVNLPLSTETPISTETATPTETIVWFPASATATQLLFPTYTGTPDRSPGIGRVMLE